MILGNTGYTSIADTGRFWEILVIPVLQILNDSGKYWLYQYCRYWKILENTGYTSIADTGRFWDILVFLSPFSFLLSLVSFLPVSLYTVRPLITDAQTGQKKTKYKYIPQLRT
jgi:hypothetical protein